MERIVVVADLIHALEHHAKDKADLVREIGLAYATLLSPNNWRTKNLKGGPNSWMIYNISTGKKYHIRNGGNGVITVRDAYYQGRDVAVFKTRLDVWRWARALIK